MRKIKFRGLDRSGIWHYGAFAETINTSGKLYNMPSSLCAFIIDAHYDDKVELFYEFVGIETVGQYTGLIDKNGKEIYGGDILKIISNQKGLVGWSEEFAGFVLIVNRMLYPFEGLPELLEIIGNIHQNPELME